MAQRNETQNIPNEETRSKLMEEALNRPGVREVQEVYHHWLKKNRAMDNYRQSQIRPKNIQTSDSTNVR